MRVVDRLAEREKDWVELQMLLSRMEGKRISRGAGLSPHAAKSIAVDGLTSLMQEKGLKGISAGDILRLGELYR